MRITRAKECADSDIVSCLQLLDSASTTLVSTCSRLSARENMLLVSPTFPWLPDVRTLITDGVFWRCRKNSAHICVVILRVVIVTI